MKAATLRGKSIAITGASSGIGMATALAAARAGMRVAVGARRIDRLEALVGQIRNSGGEAHAIACDVSRQEDCERFVAESTGLLGPPDALFANAGMAYETPLLSMSDAAFRETLETNFYGSWWSVRAALPAMIRRGSGHVLFCSSCLSKIGTPCFAAYSMSKAMQDHAARGLRVELRGTGVRVSSVHPIGTRTEFFDQAKSRSPGARLLLATPEGLTQPPERVADAVIRCLLEPRGEVWTSLPVRVGLGLGVMFPGLADRFLTGMMERRGRAHGDQV
jgi:NAD(P)-dependent dehydrogenase (short-subunit alcohol dehydrogenase family)